MIKFRCSSLGSLMTEPRSKSETLSETCKTYLVEAFVGEQYGRYKEIGSKYLDKGNEVERLGITLYSAITKRFLVENEKQYENDFIKGKPDVFQDGTIYEFKSSWDIFSFWKARTASGINKDYLWQVTGYMALTGAKSARLIYCLIDTPDQLIEDEKWRLARKMGVIDAMHHPDYVEACKQLDHNMKYGDIPMKDRFFQINIERDQKAIDSLYERVGQCREYMDATFWPERQLEESLKT